VSYTINSGPDALVFRLTTKSISELFTVVRQGNQASTLYLGLILKCRRDSFDIRYLLNIKENNATTYTMISNDKVTVAVPAAALLRPVILMLNNEFCRCV
jgi:hypothetical protein